jgi:hypothetical protein
VSLDRGCGGARRTVWYMPTYLLHMTTYLLQGAPTPYSVPLTVVPSGPGAPVAVHTEEVGDTLNPSPNPHTPTLTAAPTLVPAPTLALNLT